MFGMGKGSAETDLDATQFEAGFSGTDDSLLLDVRTPQEYAEGHIPGALNMDMYSNDFVQRVEALDRQKPIYLYCRSGNRSGSVLQAMKQMGFTKVYHLAHGILGWQGATE